MNADRIAAFYRLIEYCAFGKALERRRFAFLPRVRNARNVLIAGEGDGRFVAKLVEQNPAATIVVLESSAEMIRLARELASCRRTELSFHQGNALRLPPGGPYDLVVTRVFPGLSVR
ncbi:MAG: class I SAM-dependent methyltransferase [Paludibaculum sp.]